MINSKQHSREPRLDPEDAAVISTARLRLIPFLFILYIVAYLDRINVSFAQLQMRDALGFGDAVYGLGAGMFFIGYFVFEIPSNLILRRVGARLWISRIMVTWGLLAAGMCLVKTATGFYILRFLLGVAEAGFFPGIVYYLSNWFPESERARSISLFMMATALSGVIGGPVSGLLLNAHGYLGLDGWQWLFLIEGLPACALGIVVYLVLPDSPRDARWLKESQAGRLEDMIEAGRQTSRKTVTAVRTTFIDMRVWRLAAMYFMIVIGMYGVGMWLPTIIKELYKSSNLVVGLLSAIPFAAAAIGMTLIGASSDRTGERRLHVAVPAFAAAAALVTAGLIKGEASTIVCLSVAAYRYLGRSGAVLDVPDSVPPRRRGGGGDRPDQLGRQPRRLHGPERDRIPQGEDWRFLTGSVRDRLSPGHRRSSGAYRRQPSGKARHGELRAELFLNS